MRETASRKRTQTSAGIKRERDKRQRLVRRNNLARTIRLSWESLRSHLSAGVRTRKGDGANEEFHARAVREYSEIIYTASVELHELTKIDFPAEYEARELISK
jgi:hypothetical protein